MKKLFLLLLLFIYAFGSEASMVTATSNYMSQTARKREVPVKNTTGVPIFRSPDYSPVQVFVDDNVLMISFQEVITGVTVKVENVKTEDVVFLDSNDVQKGTHINVFIAEVGMYRISFSTETYSGYGEFIIYES